MSFIPRKRKERTYYDTKPPNTSPEAAEETSSIDYSLFIQAHEADLVRGPQAHVSARSLEVEKDGDKVTWVGDGLIKWGVPTQDEGSVEAVDDREGIWVDRYGYS